MVPRLRLASTALPLLLVAALTPLLAKLAKVTLSPAFAAATLAVSDEPASLPGQPFHSVSSLVFRSPSFTV